MKIAQVSTTCFFQPDYYTSNEYILCHELAKLGHEVEVFVPDMHPKWLKTIKYRKIEKEIEERDGFIIHRLHTGPEIGYVPTIPTLLSTLLRMKFDVIHSHDYHAPSSFYSAIVSRVKRTPLIITQHNDVLPTSVIKEFLYLYDVHTFGRYTVFQTEKIIALTTAMKDHLILMGVDKEKIEVIPNAVDTKIFSPNRRNLLEARWGISSPVILFVGRLVEAKGVKYLFEAFSKVCKEVPDAKLVIVGIGPMENELRGLQRNHGINNVFFLGRINSKFMPEIYAGCDVLVAPSLHKETFGNVVIEAMAAGKPVIGSYVGGMKDTIVHGMTGFHIQPGNSEQISNFLLKLLKNALLRKEMGKKARKRAIEVYNQDRVLEKIENMYFNVTRNGIQK